MNPRRARLVASFCVLALAGCSTTDSGYARRTRSDREYHGGVAYVPDGPSESSWSAPSASDVLAFLGVFALAFAHGVDHVGPLPQSFESMPTAR